MDVKKKECKKTQMKNSDENKKIPRMKKKIMYVNQINRMPFFDEEKGFDFNVFKNILKENLKSEDGYKWAFILHDLDVLNDGTPKPAHIHLIIQNQKGISMKLLKSILKDDNLSNYEYLHGLFKASEMYIIHDTNQAKEDNKHAYDEHSVISNYDYVSEIKKHRKNRDKAKEKKDKDDYIHKILNGDLIMDDFTSFGNEEEKERAMFYANNKKKVDDAFTVRAKIERKNEMEKIVGEYPSDHKAIEKPEDEKRIIWIYGNSGVGKSLVSRLLAKKYSKNASEIYFSSSKNDVFQDYNNQRIVVLEELRPNAIDIDDLFKLFDRIINVSMKRRYKNVDVKADVIIINSILSPIEFYARKFDRKCDLKDVDVVDMAIYRADTLGEPAFQLFRRITQVVKVLKKDDLKIFANIEELKKEKKTKIIENYFDDDDFLDYDHFKYVGAENLKINIDEEHQNILKIEASKIEKEKTNDDFFEDDEIWEL